jgi:hypothetical protein
VIYTDGNLQLSASSAALDLANLQSPKSETSSEIKTNGWPSFSRHRHAQHSMPQNILDTQKFVQSSLASPSASSQQSVETVVESPSAIRKPNRHSMEATLASFAQKGFNSSVSGSNMSRPSLASLQSYSTNDIPTLKGNNVTSSAMISSPIATTANDSFHKHNASLGRIPANAMNNRLSRDLTNGDLLQEDPPTSSKSSHSELQASAAPFGPTTTVGTGLESSVLSPDVPQFNPQNYYGAYGMSLLNMGAINPMQMANASAYGNGMQFYQQNQYGSYSPYDAGRFPDSQARVIQQRRMQNAEGKTSTNT